MNSKNIFEREALLIGEPSLQKIQNASVILLGLGGVGSYAFENLVRAGIEKFVIVDKDIYEITNLNRQLYALQNTINKCKVDVAYERAMQINPNCNIIKYASLLQEIDLFEIIQLFNSNYVFVADCIDDTNAKLSLYKFCIENNITIISCMGSGNKISTLNFKITTLDKTSNCHLAKKLRKEFSKICLIEDMKKINVVSTTDDNYSIVKKPIPTISYVPARCGLLVCEFIINKILNEN